MAHTLILGESGSGKTMICTREIIPRLKRRQEMVIVWTPVVSENRWQRAGADLVVYTRADFLAVMRDPATRKCHVFVDEGLQTIGRYDPELEALATEMRNYGHSLYLLAQAAPMLNKNVRRQCEQVICFQQMEEDCPALKRQFSEPELLKAPLLKKGEYIRKRRFQPFKRGKVDLSLC